MAYKTNVFITKEDDWYVVNSLETNVTSQGKTVEEAVANLKEALELFFEGNKDNEFNNNVVIIPNHDEIARGTLRGILKQADIDIEDFIKLL